MSMTYVGDLRGDFAKWIMIGGNFYNSKTEMGESSDQVWMLELTKNEYTWKHIEVSGTFMPRFQHAHTLVANKNSGQNYIYVHGGFYDSYYRYVTTHKLHFTNDSNTPAEFSWEMPVEEEKGLNKIPDDNYDAVDGPSPRGRHTATYIDGKVWLIGGHGGSLYARQYFDDVWVYDCETNRYEKFTAKSGKFNERCGHTANLMHDGVKILVYGGWNNKTCFSDILILDTEKQEWIEIENTSPLAKWNHCSVMVEAIPNWRYFLFGGSETAYQEGEKRTPGKYSNNVLLYMVETETWQDMELDQKPSEPMPEKRESCSILYDIKRRRMLIYGGYSNEWLDDLWSLDVSQIVGPSYSIERIEPNMGPISGNTRITVYGKGFHEGTSKYRLLFKIGNKWEEADPGNVEWNSKTEIVTLTPNFRKYGTKTVDVYIMIDEDLISVTKTNFSFYVDTMCEKSCVYGPGIHHEQNAGEETSFLINARDEDGQNRQSGRDEWIVQITEKDTQESVACTITDNDDGTYLVKYMVDRQTDIVINISIQDYSGTIKNIKGSPYNVKMIEMTEETKGLNSIDGNLIVNYIKDKTDEIRQFINQKNVALDIEKRNYHDGAHELLDIKMNFTKVIEWNGYNERLLDQLYEYIIKLSHKKELKGYSEKIRENQKDWIKLYKHAEFVKKELDTTIKSEKDKTTHKISSFEENLKKEEKNMKSLDYYKYETGTEASFKTLDYFENKLDRLQKELDEYQVLANGFDDDNQTNGCKKILEVINTEFTCIRQLWNHIKYSQEKLHEIYNYKFKEINLDELEDIIRSLTKTYTAIKNIKQTEVAKTFKSVLNAWPNFINNLRSLKETFFTERHWKMICTTVEKPEFDFKNPNLNMKQVWDLKLEMHQEAVEDIFERSKQEFKMGNKLDEYDNFYKDIQFDYTETKSYQSLKLLNFQDEYFNNLEEQMLQAYNFNNNRFKDFLEEKINHWVSILNLMNDVIVLLKYAQNKWSFLEKMFVQSPEVKKELGEKAVEFVKYDELMKEVLKMGMNTPNVRKFCTTDGLKNKLKSLCTAFDDAEDFLNRNYLKLKKNKFPRFYFVSEDDLLYMLSNSNTPGLVMEYINKVMICIKTISLKEDGGGGRPTAINLVSAVGVETINFSKEFKLNGKTEEYLDYILENTISSMTDLMNVSYTDYPTKKRVDWVTETKSAQITLLISLLFWCVGVENAFSELKKNPKAMDNQAIKCQKQLEDLIKLVQGKLDKPTRTKIMCMITLDTHGRDISIQLHESKVLSVDGFQWQAQLKCYYNNEAKDVEMHICDARFKYSYEYLGNGPRLVVTPLTDRIYVTATQALHLKLGCAPAGPAGTGKTETTKDLANALAKACYVFNCSDQMNYESLGNIYKGLAASGTWGCFDEFNRLIPEVLSVCAFQFGAVCDGVREKASTIILENETITLDVTCGAFITMNPGYLGRSELPEKLKALFRPITVMVPDLVLICENFLMAEGFVEAKELASKFFTLYNLSKSLLSPAMWYDWGLRAIKTVLVVAGAFKRSEPEVSEADMLMRVLRDINMPKLSADDRSIFSGLLNDLFPGLNPPVKIDEALYEYTKEALIKLNKFPEPEFINKVLQLKEILEIRHCVFVMGNPGSFKSTCWTALKGANDIRGEPTKIIDINPKSISSDEFYGNYNSGGSWKQGIFSYYLKELGKEKDTNPKWIVLDGDLDANWIESMNSVMDDNKVLTLANSDRIVMYNHIKMLLEIRDLRFATPATVSRGGVIYIYDESGWQWRSYVEAWLDSCRLLEFMKKGNIPDDKQKEVMELLRSFLLVKYVPKMLEQFKKFKRPFTICDIALVATTCKIFDAIFEGNDIERLNYIEQWFAFAAIWAFGGSVSLFEGEDYKKTFSKFFSTEYKGSVKTSRSVFDYFIADNNEFKEWTEGLENTPFDSLKQSITSVVVETPETRSYSYFIEKLLKINYPTLVVGPAGSGKSQLIKGVLEKLNPKDFNFKAINFNYYTDSMRLQTQLESTLKKQGKTFKPIGGNVTLIYFVDDLNMPKCDPYDTQSAIALIRQSIDFNHWYDREKVELKTISNTMYISAMNPTAGSFFVNPRLQRHFYCLMIQLPENQSLMKIYKTFTTNHFKPFNKNVSDEAEVVCKTALMLHQEVCNKFKKTAANFHYEFNIRHLTGVFQGVLQAKLDYFKEAEKLAKLWVHESERIYGDRLVSNEDVTQYLKLAAELVKKNIKHGGIQQYFNEKDPKLLVFAPFFNDELAYDDINEMPKLRKRLEESLEEYNESNPNMDLVLFEDACKHVCRIARVVISESGHALLVGVGGSGKQSLSRLSSFMNRYITTGIVVTSDYNEKMLREDIQEMYKKAAIKNEGVMWLMTDSQIIDEKFMVFINDLLSSGEISGLFPDDEIDNIVGTLSNPFKNENPGMNVDKDNVYKFFLTRIKKNLHMSLCFSPVGENLRVKARKFPGLVNSTVIDWFQKWPTDALRSVSKKFLDELDLGSEEIKQVIIEFMPISFDIVQKESVEIYNKEKRNIYTTPKSFLELIKLYKNKLGTKRTYIEENRDRYITGVKLLEDIQNTVTELNEVLVVKRAEVEEKKANAESIEAVVKVEKDKVEKESALAQIELDKASTLKEFIANKKGEIEGKIAVAMPKVQETLAKLENLDKKQVEFIKSLASPDDKIKQTMYTLMHLFTDVQLNASVKSNKGKIDLNWNNAKVLIKEPAKFVTDMKTYGSELVRNSQVPQPNFVKARKLMDEEGLTYEVLKPKSEAAATFIDFAVNIIDFNDVMRLVGPMEAELTDLSVKLAEANESARQSQEKVDKLNAMLKELVDKYDQVNAEKESALAEAKVYEDKASLATRLINALKAEYDRWKDSIGVQERKLIVVCGDVLLSAAFISYIGPFSKYHRINIMKEFVKYAKETKVPLSEDFDPVGVFADGATIAEWNNNYLPADAVSSQNGMILANSERWSLIIDPQLQGLKWLKEQFKDNLIVLKYTDKGWKNDLFNAIETGKIVIFENLDESIDPTISPVIGRNYIKRGGSRVLKIGDRELNVHAEFKLFMQSKLSNPHYPPEIQAECTLINFSVTEEGLEDQLLSLIVRMEREDLANTKEDLVKAQRNFNIQLSQLENNLLAQLKNAGDDILANIGLIENLEESKKISDDIKIKVEQGRKTEESIALFSEKYRPAAERGALIFFLMNELYKIHTFYMYSLRSFIFVIRRAIGYVQADWDKRQNTENKDDGENNDNQDGEEGAEVKNELSDEELTARIQDLTESITSTSWDYMRRGLFDKHKVVVISILCFRIKVKKGQIPIEQYNNLIMGKPFEGVAPQPEQLKFMQESNWLMIKGLEGLYVDIVKNVSQQYVEWRKWYEKQNPESEGFPKFIFDKTEFEKLLFLRALRPDRMEYALKNYITQEMGAKYTEKPPFDMVQTYNESDSTIPLFFVLFPGVEPTKDIREIASKNNKSVADNTLIEISMGQGQEDRANKALVQAAQDGNWVVLNNIHLMQTWTKLLELKLDEIAPTAHEEFRCFLSSEPPPMSTMKLIPEPILQNSIKVSNEAPQDVKSNMLRAYKLFSQDRIDKCAKKTEYKAILFGLCTFHSFILARKKFGSQGWSRMYSFNDGDLNICGDILTNYLNMYDKIPWDDLRYLFGEIMYGGHITDAWDRRTNNAYLRVLIHDQLLERFSICPNFNCPEASKNEYDDYIRYINEKLPPETTEMIKINNLAEIGYLTNTSNFLFETILMLSGTGSSSSKESKMEDKINFYLQNPMLKTLDIPLIKSRKDLKDLTPYDIVALQEVEQMNVLVEVMKASLEDLLRGLRGELNITDAMEVLQSNLIFGKVTPIWQKYAYDSLKGLAAWFADLLLRIDQLCKWTDMIIPNPPFPLPQSIWISGLFNPLKFLTACMQVIARKRVLPLDDMAIITVVTEFRSCEEAKMEEECALIHGLFLEGADWESKPERGEGYLKVYEEKKIHPEMPVIEIRPDKLEEKAKTYTRGYYQCPVYRTSARGATFIWPANLKMRDDSELEDTWTLYGTCLLLNDD